MLPMVALAILERSSGPLRRQCTRALFARTVQIAATLGVTCRKWKLVRVVRSVDHLLRKSLFLQHVHLHTQYELVSRVSHHIYSLVEICPETDPKLIGLNFISQYEKNVDVNYANCGQYMQTFNCVSDLGFQLDGVSSYLAPQDPFQSGTATLSNGQGTVTAPASGAVFTYTNGGDGQVYTITAANFNGKDDSGSSGSSSGSGSGSVSGSESQDASPSSTSSSKNDDGKGGAGTLSLDTNVFVFTAFSILTAFFLHL